MKCPRCQADSREGARFCRECGALLGAVCPNCGARIEADSKFCESCGAPATSTAAPSRFASPQSYTPKHLAEKIVTSRGSLEGERKQVTVLFADLKGSMELLADRDPEEAMKLLDPVLQHMMEAVHRYEGHGEPGDGRRDHGAVRRARWRTRITRCVPATPRSGCRRRCVSYAEGMLRAHGIPVRMRVGLNSGRGRGALHRLRPAHGLLRSRTDDASGGAHGAAGRGRDDPAHPRTRWRWRRDSCRWRRWPRAGERAGDPRRDLRTDGREPACDRACTRRRRAASRASSAATPRWRILRQALALGAQGQGQVVAIVGEPGVGKSRLVWEFTHSHRTQGWLVLESDVGVLRQGDRLLSRDRAPAALLRRRDPATTRARSGRR